MEQIKARRDANNEILKAAREITSSPAFRQIESGINDAIREVNKFSRALDSLTTKGVYGYMEEMSRDEQAELDRQIQQLVELQKISKVLEDNLLAAIDALNENKGRVTSAETAIQTRIIKLQEEIKLKPFEDAYRNKVNDYDRVAGQIQVIVQTLKNIRSGIDANTKAAQQVVEALKKATPRITLIVVKASTEVFAKNEPLLFSVDVEWIGETKKYEVTWSPGSRPADLFKDVADKVVGFR